MARLRTFVWRVTFGENAPDTLPEYLINGFEVPFDDVEGEPGPGRTVTATAHPESYPHTLVLQGPPAGQWDLLESSITYHYENEPPWTCRLGAVVLRENRHFQLLYAKPNRIIQV